MPRCEICLSDYPDSPEFWESINCPKWRGFKSCAECCLAYYRNELNERLTILNPKMLSDEEYLNYVLAKEGRK